MESATTTTTARTRRNIYADLPTILYIERVHDCGPMEEGRGGACPHCGAEGRYIYIFLCSDGTTRGAMKGCLSKFKMHPFAKAAQRILEKEQENRKKGWKLASWDVATMDAVHAFAQGEITEDEASARIRQATAEKTTWMRKRGYR